jgi:hypothetical protein
MRPVLVATALLGALAACTADSDSGGLEDDAEGSVDALSVSAVQGYAAVSPPEPRVTTTEVTPRLGVKLPAGARLAVIRTLALDGKKAWLVVDVDRSMTALVDESALTAKTRLASATDRIEDSPYAKSLAELATSSKAITSIDRDATIEREVAEPFTLTIDMCQSKKPWEKSLFDWAVGLSNDIHAPVPIGIAMTGT